MQRTANALTLNGVRGFESHPHRQGDYPTESGDILGDKGFEGRGVQLKCNLCGAPRLRIGVRRNPTLTAMYRFETKFRAGTWHRHEEESFTAFTS